MRLTGTCALCLLLLVKFIVLDLVLKLTCWEAQQIPKGVNRAALFHVEQAVCVHVVLFYVCELKCFYWLVVHLHYNNFCVWCPPPLIIFYIRFSFVMYMW